MDISGKIIAVCDLREGTSRAGSPWASQDYVIETHEQYPKRCCFNVFGMDRIKEFNIQVGEEVTVSFDINAREYQGRWFNDIRAWRVQRGAVADFTAPAAPAPAAPAAPAAPTMPEASGTQDDLPF